MTTHHTASKLNHMIVGAAIALTIAGSAGATMLAAADNALAPGPAKLSAALAGTSGATAAAVYVGSNQPTSVRYYSSSWTSDSQGPAAGTPCSSVALARDQVATKVIQVQGSYRRCI